MDITLASVTRVIAVFHGRVEREGKVVGVTRWLSTYLDAHLAVARAAIHADNFRTLRKKEILIFRVSRSE